MASRIEPVVHYLRKIARDTGENLKSDGQLLSQFIATRDEAAFEELVRRHLPMIFGVCRRLTRNATDAEDALQAALVVLARKAGTIASRESVGSWLYAVAYKTALAARVRSNRRQARERPMTEMAQPVEDEWQRLLPYLDRELNRLPDKYRLPLVLCAIEGRPRKEVARQLGLCEGTLSSRLATARKMLAKRLAQFGEFSGAALAAALLQTSEASLPVGLTRSTVKAALAGGSASAAALATGVVKAMLITKLKSVCWVVALAATVGVGVAGFHGVLAEEPVTDRTGGAATAKLRTRATADELDVLRLEIEALRKDLKITKDRVHSLEADVVELKKPAVGGLSQMDGVELRNTDLSGHPQKVMLQTPDGERVTATHQKSGELILRMTNPFVRFERAIKKVRQNPADKQALQELEAAANALKQAVPTSPPLPAPPANKAPGATWIPAPRPMSRLSPADSKNADVAWRMLGLRLVPVSAGSVAKDRPELHGGMLIAEVRPDGAAARAGLRRGDVVLALHQWQTLNAEDVHLVLNHPDLASFLPLRFYILRADKVHQGWIHNLD